MSGQVGELSSNSSRSVQIFPAYLHPKSRGFIRLKSKNPFDPPKIFANYLDEEQDIKALVEGIRFAIKLSKTSALRAYGISLDTTPIEACKTIKFDTQVKMLLPFLFTSKLNKILFILGILGMCSTTQYRCRKSSSRKLQNGSIPRSASRS